MEAGRTGGRREVGMWGEIVRILSEHEETDVMGEHCSSIVSLAGAAESTLTLPPAILLSLRCLYCRSQNGRVTR